MARRCLAALLISAALALPHTASALRLRLGPRTVRPWARAPLAAPPAEALALGTTALSAIGEDPAEIHVQRRADVDWKSLRQAGISFAAQLLLINAFAKCVVCNLAALAERTTPVLGTVTAALWFLVMAKQSRIFSPLDAARPNNNTAYGKKWKTPSWAPPPLTFPIVWSIICILRCVSATMVWQACGRDFVAWPLWALYAHLSFGDVFNNFYHVQKRLGPGAASVWFVLGSAVGLALTFYKTLPLAGFVIAPSVLWLVIATTLVNTIWWINGRPSWLPRTV